EAIAPYLFTWKGGAMAPAAATGLPGIVAGQLWPRVQGWAIAIPNCDGEIVGAQIKNPQGGYFWASHADHAPVQLPNGELPLGVYGTPTGDGVVNLAEGFFKPAIAAARHGGAWVGAAGGNWASAPEQLKAILEALNAQQVVLAADGGAVANPHVMGAYSRLAARLEAWGIPLAVRWWGQRSKADGDVDEITPEQYQAAVLLPWAEFQALATPAPIDQRRGRDQAEAEAAGLTLEEYRLQQRLTNPLGRILPSMRVNTRDLSEVALDAIPETGVIALRSAKGTGKTKAIAKLTGNPATLLLGHRIALTRNLCQRLGVNYRGDLDKAAGRFTDGEGFTLRVGGCVDGTLLAINPSDFAGCDLILDEVVQVLRHLLTSSTCNKEGKRPVLLARFTEVVRAARRVILADADLNKDVLDYIQSLRGDGAPAWLLVNNATVEPWPISWIESPDASAITAQLLEDVAAGERVFVATDSKAGGKRLDRLIAAIEGANIPVLLLNSETSSGDIERAFIQNPDDNLDWPVVIATPSLGTGVSIESEYFTRVYGVFWGASSTDADMSQALARCRYPVPRVVWCAQRGRNYSPVGRDTNPLRLKTLLQDRANATAQLTAASLGALGAEITGYDWLNPHLDLWAKIEADRNRSMANLRAALKVRLSYEGHQLTVVQLDANQATHVALREARIALRESEAAAIERAENITPLEARVLETAEGIDEAGRLALQKFYLAEFYAIHPEDVTRDLVQLDNAGRYRGQLSELESLLHPEVATGRDVRSIERQAFWGHGITPWDAGTAELRRQLRQQIGLDQWIRRAEEWASGDGELAQLDRLVRELAPQVRAALNVSVNEAMAPQQVLGQLLEQIGISTTSRQIRDGEKRRRAYAIDQEALAGAIAILDRRAERRKALDKQPSIPVTPSPSMETLAGGCDTLEPPDTGISCAGELVRYGNSIGLWAVLATEGDTATIQLQNPLAKTVLQVPITAITSIPQSA
ncbi:MAG: plasmid replication protein, CyRepA1 family, partial [Nodosilinea sp.]